MDSRFLVACGFWDNSFRVFSTETGNKACGYVFALKYEQNGMPQFGEKEAGDLL